MYLEKIRYILAQLWDYGRRHIERRERVSISVNPRTCAVQAPSSMKSVVLAGWLLTTACGSLIDVVVTATRVISQVR